MLSERIGAQKQRHREDPARFLEQLVGLPQRLRHHAVEQFGFGGDAVADQQGMAQEKAKENRQQDLDRLLHAAQVEQDQQAHQRQFADELVGLPVRGQQAEHRIRRAGHRNGDGQHIVHNQRRAGQQAGIGADQARRRLVAAAAGREQLNHLIVGQRDDEHRHRRGDCQIKPQMGMHPQRQKRFFGAVTCGRKSVRTQPDPGQERHQHDVLPGIGIERIELGAEQQPANRAEEVHGLRVACSARLERP